LGVLFSKDTGHWSNGQNCPMSIIDASLGNDHRKIEMAERIIQTFQKNNIQNQCCITGICLMNTDDLQPILSL
jgi:hypothetical protein